MKKAFYFTALFLLAAYGVFAQSHINWYVPPKGEPKNIIVFLGEGLGFNEISSAFIKSKEPMAIPDFSQIGFAYPWKNDEFYIDPIQINNRLAIGQKFYGRLGVTEDGIQAKNFFDLAKSKNIATAFVTTLSLTDPSAASFVVHQSKDLSDYDLAADYLNSNVDILVGGGSKFFNKRPDSRNLLVEFGKTGYEVSTRPSAAAKLAGSKVLALIGEGTLYRPSNRGEVIPKASAAALQSIMGCPAGFFMLIQNGTITKGGQANDINYVSEEVLDFDKTIRSILNIIGKDEQTLILIIGTNETGGLSINSFEPGKKPDITAGWTSKSNSTQLLPVFAVGPGADKFKGFFSLGDIYEKISGFISERKP